MKNPLLIRKLVEDEVEKLKSSSTHSSDADLYVGFKFGDKQDTANENEYDPKTGKLIKNDEIGDYTTYLQQWDSDDSSQPYLETNGRANTGFGKIVMQQVTPIR